MSFELSGSALQGSGSVTGFTNFVSVPLSLTGTRTADTLDITYMRPDKSQMHFVGHYILSGQVITGVLSGGEFNSVTAQFKNH